MASTIRIFTDRSRIESYQRCNRLRWLEYHQDGRGITSARKPLPLAVGGAVHAGLAYLLHAGQIVVRAGDSNLGDWRGIEDKAVALALQDFAAYANALDVDTAESPAGPDGAPLEPQKRSEFDDYLYREQSALIEALVRAYSRRRLRPLLEAYEVLEVEREGEWLLATAISRHEWNDQGFCNQCRQDSLPGLHDENCPNSELWFMSRPDALLLDRQSRQLYLQSFKTAASWDVRKERDAQHDMQGLSEGVEVEKRLGEWWEHGQMFKDDDFIGPNKRTMEWLKTLPAPPRILGIRYEYLLKGERWRDKDLSARLGVEARSQKSALVRGYYRAEGEGAWNWSWDYLKPDELGATSKLNYRQWKSAPVWEAMPVAKWIDMLDATAMVVGEEGVERGYGSEAQATGFTADHPLDAVFPAPLIVYRNSDELRDWVEQVEAQEVRVAEAVMTVEAATDDGERRAALNRLFPMTRRACEYPTTCGMSKVCWGGEDIRRDPIGSGLYKARVPNHPQENTSLVQISLDTPRE